MSARKIFKKLPGPITLWNLSVQMTDRKKIRHGAINVGSGYQGEGQINSNGDKIDLACRKGKVTKTRLIQNNNKDTHGPHDF